MIDPAVLCALPPSPFNGPSLLFQVQLHLLIALYHRYYSPAQPPASALPALACADSPGAIRNRPAVGRSRLQPYVYELVDRV
jgi:hypothetical protein